MYLTSVAVFTALFAQDAFAQNFLRFGCSQLVIERTDPLVDPGKTPASHTHQVVGGNSFNASVRSSLCCLYLASY